MPPLKFNPSYTPGCINPYLLLIETLVQWVTNPLLFRSYSPLATIIRQSSPFCPLNSHSPTQGPKPLGSKWLLNIFKNIAHPPRMLQLATVTFPLVNLPICGFSLFKIVKPSLNPTWSKCEGFEAGASQISPHSE